jgi:hypothetical protein
MFAYWANTNPTATAGIGISAIIAENVGSSSASFEFFIGG